MPQGQPVYLRPGNSLTCFLFKPRILAQLQPVYTESYPAGNVILGTHDRAFRNRCGGICSLRSADDCDRLRHLPCHPFSRRFLSSRPLAQGLGHRHLIHCKFRERVGHTRNRGARVQGRALRTLVFSRLSYRVRNQLVFHR